MSISFAEGREREREKRKRKEKKKRNLTLNSEKAALRIEPKTHAHETSKIVKLVGLNKRSLRGPSQSLDGKLAAHNMSPSS